MKKTAINYVCSNCGATSARWSGRCSTCGEWNTLSEQLNVNLKAAASGQALKGQSLRSVIAKDEKRYNVGMEELDAVLGGGVVAGSVILIAGQPGIGKSTLLLQSVAALANKHTVLYVSGEESGHQIGMRAKRLGLSDTKAELVASNSADDIATTVSSGAYDVVVVDSIQTTVCRDISASAGSISQISSSAQLLIAAAKQSGCAVILVGHVTKEGSIAGPKVLEHLVDVVLQLEGDRLGGFKILRSIKNRFGSTNETAIFEMDETGLKPVKNPSAALLAERQVIDGSVVFATVEGTRALLVEIQALVNRTTYGYPKRASSGIDLNRVNLLIAMLDRRTNLNLADMDVYINVVGGIKITENAADLAVCMAIASAVRVVPLAKNPVVFGEVGLSGEIRHVPYIDKRLEEAKKLGFKSVLGPRASSKQPPILTSASNINDALNNFLKK